MPTKKTPKPTTEPTPRRETPRAAGKSRNPIRPGPADRPADARPPRPRPPPSGERPRMPPAATNKQQVLTFPLTALKKKFPAPPEPEKRPVLEEVLYAVVREGVPSAAADAAFARLKSAFF